MDLLEHPLEAVAFRLYSLPIPDLAASSVATGAAAAWTCLAAVLAAAAAVAWRLRSSTTAAAAVVVSTKNLELDPSPVAEVSPSRPSSLRSPEPAVASTTKTMAAADHPSSPKERYTAYYRDAGCVVGCCDVGSDEDDGDHEEDDDEDGGDSDVFVSDGADPFGWEVVVRSPTTTVSDMGTPRQYRRRSPTALSSGSVVQLWDQGGLTTPTASPRRRGRVVVGAVSAL